MAELTIEEKNNISHRGKALREMEIQDRKAADQALDTKFKIGRAHV